MGEPTLSVFHPSDFSRESEVAFMHALKVALAGETRLTILHTDAPGDRYAHWHDFPSVRGLLSRWDLLDEGASRAEVRDELGLDVEKIELIGEDPVDTMLHYLGRHPADLLVLATHGREGLPRFLRGSVAEPLARGAGTMALFVPHGVDGFVNRDDGSTQLDRVLIPIDHKPSPVPAVQAAVALASALGASDAVIEMLHVGDTAPRIHEDVLGGHGAEIRTRQGPVVDAILDEATERKAGLIVMATEGHDGVLDALRGSTTEQVVRRAPCPVLAVPAVNGSS
jgi:nucleotide-binding universal stress UspA family protein